MSITAEQMAQRVIDAIRAHSMGTDRAAQQAEHRIGASEIGHCRAYLAWMTLGIEYDESDDPKWEAFIGTAIGDRIEDAYIAEHPNALKQASFDCTLPSGKVIPCHPDLLDPDINAIVDLKTKNGLALVTKDGRPSQAHEYQVLIYARGAAQAGILAPGATLYLMYFDRSGARFLPVTYEVAMTNAIYDEIDEWIDEAMYHVREGSQPPRDKPYEFCESYCHFFTHCRGEETREEGLIEDEDVKTALKIRLEAMAELKDAKSRKEQADAILTAHDGRVITDEGIFEISHTVVNGGGMVAYEQSGYTRLNIRKARPERKVKKDA